MRPSALANRKALQLYVVLMLGLFCYLHFIHGRGYYTRDSTLEVSEFSSSYSKFAMPGYEDPVQQHQKSTGGPPNRFVLGLNYWEQFTMATGNLLSLVCLGEQWNATTVQPFTFNSRLYGLQNFKPGRT